LIAAGAGQTLVARGRRPRAWLTTCLLIALAAGPAAADGDGDGEDEKAAAVAKGEALEGQAAGEPAAATVEPITETEAAAVDPQGDAPLEDALTCLARTVYWEAKGEELEAMEAVANVVMNRVAAADFPNTVCEVVTQGQDAGPCQFSWWCDGNPLEAEEHDRYAITMDVARRALNQELADRTDGALFFHGEGSVPGWAETYVRTVTLGGHVFYRLNDSADG
jgi:spore germination cell wall hydrolase CwlJ-like protein